MLPKPIRAVFYWMLRSGPLGRFIADIIAWGFYFFVKICSIPPRQDIAGLTIISHKHKFIFFGIPKVASRSFYTAFVINNKDSFDIEWYEKRNAFFEAKERYPDYYSFSFVRNPWSRAVSCYNSKIADNIIGKRARILSFYKGLKGGMAFSHFVEWLDSNEGQDHIADRHWISQYKFLCDDNDELICNFVGKYETLEDDWKSICQDIGLEYFQLPQRGFVSSEGVTKNPQLSENNAKSNIQKTDYHSFFDDETKTLIAKRYSKDIEMFGYEF